MSLLPALKRQFAHDAWARERLAAALRDLTAAEFARDFGPGFGSARAKFCHFVDAEHLWLLRVVNGESPTARPDDNRHAAVEPFLAWLAEVQARKQAMLDSLDEPALQRVVEYRNLAGRPFRQPLWEILQHMLLHAAYHRGQVQACLRALGKQPPETDFIVFART
ncbi:MAG: DinB family protein [Planctomycetes bacterium]|nr:DinB family protein [Planctomycetota bacterium]